MPPYLLRQGTAEARHRAPTYRERWVKNDGSGTLGYFGNQRSPRLLGLRFCVQCTLPNQGTRIVAQALLAIPDAPPAVFVHWTRQASVHFAPVLRRIARAKGHVVLPGMEKQKSLP